MEKADHCLISRNGRLLDTPDPVAFIDAMLDKAGKDKPIYVWFHGGLIDHKGGLGIAERLHRTLIETGYPIFFVWDSGILTALPEAIAHLFAQSLIGRVVGHIKNAIESASGLFGVDGQAPSHMTPEIRQRLVTSIRQDEELKEEANALADDAQAFQAFRAAASLPLTEENAEAVVKAKLLTKLVEGSPEFPRTAFGFKISGASLLFSIAANAVEIAQAVLRRNANHKGRLKEIIVEEILRRLEIGEQVWTEMKNDTANAFVSGGVGRLFIERLKEKAGPDQKIALIGHSTGAIYICHFLREAKRQGFDHKFDVVLLAPACGFDIYARTLGDCGELIRRARSFGLQMQRESDEKLLDLSAIEDRAPRVFEFFERNPQLKDVVENLYVGSLLHLVSGALEAEGDFPILGMQRFHLDPELGPDGHLRHIEACVKEFSEAANGAFWAEVDQLDGCRTNSMTHGGFDEDPLTLKSLVHFVNA